MSVLPGASEPPVIVAPEPVPRLLRDLVHERTGVFFDDDRLATMLDKLHARAVATGCQSYLDYYYILKYDADGVAEWRRVMDAFSVQETYFWREHDQVRAVVERIVPAWFRRSSRPLRIWSAACASGEEPYSIAMALTEEGWGAHPIEIIASDASEAALERARRGVYRERSFRMLPAHLRERYFTARGDDAWEISPAIRTTVDFRWANLVAAGTFAHLGELDVVFCRNVFIYFSGAAISGVVAALARQMPGGAHLFVGAAESLLKLTDEYDLQELDDAFVYMRRARASA